MAFEEYGAVMYIEIVLTHSLTHSRTYLLIYHEPARKQVSFVGSTICGIHNKGTVIKQYLTEHGSAKQRAT